MVFCPNSRHYPKDGLQSEEDRRAMLEAALAGDDRLAVSTFELGRDDWTRTAETLKHLNETLTASMGAIELFSIRGDDWLQRMKRWKALDELAGLCTFLLVSRTGLDFEELAGSDDRIAKVLESCVVMDAEGIPAVSSTDVRRAVLEGRHSNLPVPAEVEAIMRARGLYGLVQPDGEWSTLYRPGYAGRQGSRRDRQRDEVYGPGNWRTAFEWGGRTILYDEALLLYEDAYFEHLKTNPEVLEWLLNTAYEVYDNSDSNVFSGTDYRIQEAGSTHLQDISIRRCLIRLGLEFRGDHLVEIRGKRSGGFRLNPGQVPFHRPELIVQPEFKSWWNPGSIESFWQANKVLQVKEKAFGPELELHVHLLVDNGRGGTLAATRNGRPVSLPFLVWGGEPGFGDVIGAFAADLGLAGAHMRPTSSPPVTESGRLEVLSQRSAEARKLFGSR